MCLVVLAAGCVDHAITDPPEDPLRMVDDPHALVMCDASWAGLPLADPHCEAACTPKPALAGAACAATHPNGSSLACSATFDIVDANGVTWTGCCGLFGDWTTPTFVEFATCP